MYRGLKMDNKEKIKKQFGQRAEHYVASHIHRKGDDLQILIDMAQLEGNETLLDVATGGGHTANAFAPFVQRVTALDLTREMLIAAKKFIKENEHSNVVFVEGDAEKMPFVDNCFHIVTCRIAPHHFSNVEMFIREVFRVLKPNGQFLLNDNVAPEDNDLDHFYNTFEKMRDESHERAWKKSEWINMLEVNGFEVEAYKRYNKKFGFSDWCNRMNLDNEKISVLQNYMKNGSSNALEKFRIEITDEEIKSFYGEAMIVKAVKR